MRRALTKKQGTVARVLLRLPADVHATVAAAANEAGLSFNEYCVRRLSTPYDAAAFSEARSQVITQALSLFRDQCLGAIVIGSRARGESSDTSDVDVLLVLSPATALTRELYRRWDDAPLTIDGRMVDVHFTHLPSEGGAPTAAWCEAAIDGQLWFDRDGTVGARLGDVRRAIAEGRVVRSFVHGQPYWKTDHLRRAEARLAALDVLFERASWADVVRESQEVVELTLKGLLRVCGVEPPRVHDVGDVLIAEQARLPVALTPHLTALVDASRSLRRDRELAFYGAEDLTPSTFYREADAVRARDHARGVVGLVGPHISG